MEKKGQAAMEFLMTYGWAILAAIIAIAVLAYFGVFSPGKYMPNACVVNTPFGCDDSKVNSTGVYILLRNGAGDSVNITSMKVGTCTTDYKIYGMKASDQNFTEFTGCTLTTGGKYRGDITIQYIATNGEGLSKTTTGSITSTVTTA